MESIYAVFDGEKIVPEKKMGLRKGQKVIVTVLDEEIAEPGEAAIMYTTAVESGTFNYLFEEGEQEYSVSDCKEKYK